MSDMRSPVFFVQMDVGRGSRLDDLSTTVFDVRNAHQQRFSGFAFQNTRHAEVSICY